MGVKVARVITRMNVGGPARHVTILAERGEPEFETSLLAGHPDEREGSLAGEAASRGVRLTEVPHLRRAMSPLDDLRALFWLWRYFRREKPDIVATHMAKAGTLGRVAAALSGVPVIVHTFHGHVLDGYFGRVQTAFYIAVERLLGKLTTQFVAISPEVASDLDRLGIGRGKTTVVRLGLELDRLRDGQRGKLRAEYGIDSAAPVVGLVDRLVPIKAADLFLESAARVVRKRPQAKFVIVGDGELWDQLNVQVARAGLEKNVYFTGWRTDLAAVYADLDLVVCCSRNEGTPVSLIEACAAGKPVIGTKVGGIPDIIAAGVSGLVVPSGDVEALTAAIVTLIDDEDRRGEMGAAGQKLVLQRYSSDRLVEEIKALYRQLLANNALRPEPA